MQKALKEQIKLVVSFLRDGGVIAYPTEGMFGLGCDPFNEAAVRRIAEIKQRTVEQGMILIAASWGQISSLIKDVSDSQRKCVESSWPGHITWLFPASSKVPTWISGDSQKVAIRIPEHELARSICSAFGGPIVSTSANIHGKPPCKNAEEVKQQLGDLVDFVVDGEVGKAGGASTIKDLVTGKVLR